METGCKAKLIKHLAQLSPESCVSIGLNLSDPEEAGRDAPQISAYGTRGEWRAAMADHQIRANSESIVVMMKRLEVYDVKASPMAQLGVVIVTGSPSEITKILSDFSNNEFIEDAHIRI